MLYVSNSNINKPCVVASSTATTASLMLTNQCVPTNNQLFKSWQVALLEPCAVSLGASLL